LWQQQNAGWTGDEAEKLSRDTQEGAESATEPFLRLFCDSLGSRPHFGAIPSFGEKDWETQNGVVRKRIVSFCAEATWTCVVTKD